MEPLVVYWRTKELNRTFCSILENQGALLEVWDTTLSDH